AIRRRGIGRVPGQGNGKAASMPERARQVMRSRLQQRLDPFQRLLQARTAAAVGFVQADEQAIQQVLQRGVVEQRLDVWAVVVRRYQQREVGQRAQRVGAVAGDG